MDAICKDSTIDEEIQIADQYKGTFWNISG